MARAAEELAVTPGAVSRRIRGLEEHLGRKLFLRRATRLELTPAGSAFTEAAREALDRIADAAIEAAAAGMGVAIAIDGLLGPDIEAGGLVRAHEAIRPTHRHFVLQHEARLAEEPTLAAFTAWLLGSLSGGRPREESPLRRGMRFRSGEA